MAFAANSPLATGSSIHLFDELSREYMENCELCNQGPAFYRWIEQRYGKDVPESELDVCRICAGMILMVGRAM